jgi:hypothetical protein
MATVLMYLTDVEEGGETVFPHVPKAEHQTAANGWSECSLKVCMLLQFVDLVSYKWAAIQAACNAGLLSYAAAVTLQMNTQERLPVAAAVLPQSVDLQQACELCICS